MHGRLRNSSPRGQSPSRPWDRYMSTNSSTSTLIPSGRPPTSPRRPRASLPSTVNLGMRGHRPQPQLPLTLLSGTTPRRRAHASSNTTGTSSQPAMSQCLARRSRSLDGLLLDVPSGVDLGTSRDELRSQDELSSRDELGSEDRLRNQDGDERRLGGDGNNDEEEGEGKVEEGLIVEEAAVKCKAVPSLELSPEPKAVDRLVVGECEQYLSEHGERWGGVGEAVCPSFGLQKSVSCEADVDREGLEVEHGEGGRNRSRDPSQRLLSRKWKGERTSTTSNEESKTEWEGQKGVGEEGGESSTGSVMSLPLSAAEPKRKRNFVDRCVNKVRSLIKK